MTYICAQYGPNIADYSNEERMEYKLRFFKVTTAPVSGRMQQHAGPRAARLMRVAVASMVMEPA